MLLAATVVMTIMGCGDEGLSCDFVAESSEAWASKQECMQAIPEALLSVANNSYPMLTANCEVKVIQSVPMPQMVVENEAEFGEGLGPIVLAAELHEARKPALYRLKDGYALVLDETSNAFRKLGSKVSGAYGVLEDAVKLSLFEIAEATGRSMHKLREVFAPKVAE